jgi:hypothetical protein
MHDNTQLSRLYQSGFVYTKMVCLHQGGLSLLNKRIR